MTIEEILDHICDRLAERTATLFLGSGINAGILNDAGVPLPLGNGLRDWLAKDLLYTPDIDASLADVAEMARHKWDDAVVNDYLYKRFATYKPGVAHLALVQLPWDVIYTTNYDLLVEEAAKAATVQPAGTIRPVVSASDDQTKYTENDILYYKVHGSIDLANTPEGRLILTRSDFRFYELHRKPLFRRLERDLARRSFLFVGYSLNDDDFRAVIEECHNAIGGKSLPLSFAIRHSFTSAEEMFWRDKFNIQLVAADAGTFLNMLKDHWLSGNYAVIPLEERQSKQYLQFDDTTQFRKIAESFYQINVADCTGPSQPKLFFNGKEPSWGDIRDEIPPKRDPYWNMFEALFPELADPSLPPSVYLITGAAGTGKTTLVHSLAYDLAKSFDTLVLEHIPGTPLDARFISPLVHETSPQRIVIIIRHAAEYVVPIDRFMQDAQKNKLPVSVILEERKNQWIVANQGARGRLNLKDTEFELGALSSGEIQKILAALDQHGALGKLTGTAFDYQESHFTALAHKELLVALRELTTGQNFDEIIKDEFNKIPSVKAKQIYKYVAALGQIDIPVRYPVLLRLVDLEASNFKQDVFDPTQGVLISAEETGHSRYNATFRLTDTYIDS